MTVLTADILEHCAARTATYDSENRFFTEDFEELRQSGYLLAAVPTELGGLGLNLAEVCREQRRLAHRSPATALATNMHIYWTGVAADLWRAADKSLAWLLEETVAGEVFAAGHGEAGNDFPVLMSSARAERVDGGYRIYGHKTFGLIVAGVDEIRRSRHGPLRPGRPEGRARVLAPRRRRLQDCRDLGHPRDAGDPQRRHCH
jgi:alkylation response protein AidB-like acyl-CoA dehydrogenase